MDREELIVENARRRARWADDYDPLSGVGCVGPRTYRDGVWWPDTMGAVTGCGDAGWLRMQHDFEYWAARCVTIKHKTTGKDVSLRLNHAQRRVLKVLESQRLAGKPLRLILLKARQWGGSTLVQIYMAWIQICLKRNWNSLICAHVKDTAATIRGMYSKILANYPAELWAEEGAPEFKQYERTQNIRVIAGRGCKVTLASAERQDSIRGGDFAMAHLSETAYWPNTPTRAPEDLVRAVCSSIAYEPLTLVVMESTANGQGNYFHNEWVRCERGDGDKTAVFVPWFEIELYTLALDVDEWEFMQSLDGYERELWEEHGCSLEQINWYRHQLQSYQSRAQMQAEFPTTAREAFVTSGANVFAAEGIEALRDGCREPLVRGEVCRDGSGVKADAAGCLEVWEKPVPGSRYMLAVDVGGRTLRADWSVGVVMTRGGQPRVVAQWRGHIDHDLLADRMMALGHWYNDALLVIESNTLEHEREAESSAGVLERVARRYRHVYRRQGAGGTRGAVGFHTNASSKPRMIDNLVAMVREGLYVERCAGACDELSTYCRAPNGSYAARPGRYDDMLMTRAIALYVNDTEPLRLPDPGLTAATATPGW